MAARNFFKYLLVSRPLCFGRTEKTVNVQCTLLAGLEKLGPTSLRTPMLSVLGVSIRKRCYLRISFSVEFPNRITPKQNHFIY